MVIVTVIVMMIYTSAIGFPFQARLSASPVMMRFVKRSSGWSVQGLVSWDQGVGFVESGKDPHDKLSLLPH